MRSVSFAALIVGVILIPTALGFAKIDHDRDVSALERTLIAETNEHGAALDNYFARARSVSCSPRTHPRSPTCSPSPARARTRCGARAATSPRSRTSSAIWSTLYPDEHRRGVLHRPPTGRSSRAWCGARSRPRPTCRPRRSRPPFFAPTFALDFGADPPDPAVRLARHQRVGRRQRHADPAARRPQARDRALRGHGRELPPRDGRERGRPARLRVDRRPHRPGGHRRRASAARRRPAGRAADRRFTALARNASEWRGVIDVDGRRSRLPPRRRERGQRQRLDPGRHARPRPPDRLLAAIGPVPLAMLARRADPRRAGRAFAARRAAASSSPRPTPTR